MTAWFFTQDQVISEHYNKWLIPDNIPRRPYRMAKSQGLLLAYRNDINKVGDMVQLLSHYLLFFHLQNSIKFKIVIKMILNGGFSCTGYQDNLFNTGSDNLFHDILNGGPVHNGKHLFGNGFSSGQKPGPQSCHRNDCFPYFHIYPLLFFEFSYYSVY